MVQVTRRNHFYAQFALAPWTAADGRLHRYRRIHATVASDRKPPKTVAYEEDLLTLLPETADTSSAMSVDDSIEQEFTKLFDTPASDVLKKFLANPMPTIDDAAREAWARFMLSVLLRNPSTIASLSRESVDQGMAFLEQLASTTRDGQELLRQATTTYKLGVWTSNAVKASVLALAKQSDWWVSLLAKMKWNIIDLRALVAKPGWSDFELLTGDEPIHFLPVAAEQSFTCVTMPLSPEKLLFLCPNEWQVDNDFLRTLSASHNLLVLQHWRHGESIYSRAPLRDGEHFRFERALELYRAEPQSYAGPRLFDRLFVREPTE